MNYKDLMKKCIELAKLAEGEVSPNPLVGCVILDDKNNIISTGFHKKCGENHAERDALLKLRNGEDKGGTLIVNLEPCSHYGKTPPCADLIIERGIKRVVVGMKDVNPIVSGNGIKKLREAGIEVIENVFEKECRELNEIFIKNMLKNETFVAIKTAVTLDGKIAAENGSSKWITSEAARGKVKNLRKKYDAILTSSATVIADNPTMAHKRKIIIDRELKTDFYNANIYADGEKFVFYDKNILSNSPKMPSKSFLNEKHITLCPTEVTGNKIDFSKVLKEIYNLGIKSIIVEAGGKLNGSILPYTDKIYQFIAPKILGDNKGLSCFDFRHAASIEEAEIFKIQNIQKFPPDILVTLTK